MTINNTTIDFEEFVVFANSIKENAHLNKFAGITRGLANVLNLLRKERINDIEKHQIRKAVERTISNDEAIEVVDYVFSRQWHIHYTKEEIAALELPEPIIKVFSIINDPLNASLIAKYIRDNSNYFATASDDDGEYAIFIATNLGDGICTCLLRQDYSIYIFINMDEEQIIDVPSLWRLESSTDGESSALVYEETYKTILNNESAAATIIRALDELSKIEV